MDTTPTVRIDRHDLAHRLPRRAIAFVVGLALALTLIGPTVQPAEAQVRGGVNVSCEAQNRIMRVSTHTNASHHTVILRRWDGQQWVGVRATTTSSTLIVWGVSPGHYRLDVLGWTSASGWQRVSPVTYQSRMAGWAAPFMVRYDYCTVRTFY